MASIVFDRRRGVYAIQWHNGQRFTRSTAYQVPKWKAGGERPKKDPIDVTRALVEYKDRERRAKARAGRSREDEPLADFLRSYQETYAQVNTAGSTVQLGFAVRNFLEWCEREKIKRLDQATSSVCRAWIVARSKEISRKTKRPISYASLLKEKALLGAAWSQAVALEELDRNPWRTVDVPAKKEKKPMGSWSPEEYQRLMDAARPWLKDIIAVGCHCGIRISAMLGLERRDIRWADEPSKGLGEIRVRVELDKAGKGYSVPLHPVSHDVLARRSTLNESERLLTGEAGRPSTSVITGRAITDACRRAGLPKPVSPNHHMRRTFGRWAVLGQLTGRPVPLYVVSRWLGHSSVEMTEHYLDLSRDASADWMTDGDHP